MANWSPRHEFKRSVIVARIKLSMVNGVIYCNKCQQPCTKFHIHHIRSCGITQAETIEEIKVLTSLENSELLCLPCHDIYTDDDKANLSQAKRREAIHLGAKPAPTRKLQSRPFQPSETVLKRLHREQLPMPPRRNVYEVE